MACGFSIFQNCAPNHTSPVLHDVSPFSGSKMRLLAGVGTGATQSAVNAKAEAPLASDTINIAVVIDEKARFDGRCETANSFSKKYLTLPKLNEAELGAMTVPFRIHSLQLRRDLVEANIATLVDADECVVGVTNLSRLTNNLESENDLFDSYDLYQAPAAQAASRWLTALGHADVKTALDLEMAQTGAAPIRIGVVGTGAPAGGIAAETAPILASEPILNMFDLMAPVNDTHAFFSSATYSLIAAKKLGQPTVRGILNGGIEFLPVRAMDDASVVGSDMNKPALALALENLQKNITDARAALLALNENREDLWRDASAKKTFDRLADWQLALDRKLKEYDGEFAAVHRTQIQTQFASITTALTALSTLSATLPNATDRSQVDALIQQLRDLDLSAANFPVAVWGRFNAEALGVATSLGNVFTSAGGSFATGAATDVGKIKTAINAIIGLTAVARAAPTERAAVAKQIVDFQADFLVMQAALAKLSESATADEATARQLKKALDEFRAQLIDKTVVRLTTGLDNAKLASGIIRALNGGASVIYVPVAARGNGCDPLVGEAIFQATRAGAVVVVPAGDDAKILRAGRADQLITDETTTPACWASVYSGAIAVGASESRSQATIAQTKAAPFANVSPEIDLLAPGTSVAVLTRDLQSTVWNGSIVAAPAVVATAAWIQAYHANRGWKFTPSIVKELLRKGAAVSTAIDSTTQTNRVLHLPTMKAALDIYGAKNEDERARWLAGGETTGMDTTPNRGATYLALSSATAYVEFPERLTVRSFFTPGVKLAPVDVTNQTIWSLEDSKWGVISAQGVFVPAAGQLGKAVIVGKYTSGGTTHTAKLDIFLGDSLGTVTSAKMKWNTNNPVFGAAYIFHPQFDPGGVNNYGQTDLSKGVGFESVYGHYTTDGAYAALTDTRWRDVGASLTLPTGRKADDLRLHLGFAAYDAKALERSLTDEATFYMADADASGSRTSAWRVQKPEIDTFGLAGKHFRVLVLARGYKLESTLHFVEPSPVVDITPTLRGQMAYISMNAETLPDWVEIMPLEMYFQYGNYYQYKTGTDGKAANYYRGEERYKVPFSWFRIYLTDLTGKQIAGRESMEWRGRFLINLKDLKEGTYAVIVEPTKTLLEQFPNTQRVSSYVTYYKQVPTTPEYPASVINSYIGSILTTAPEPKEPNLLKVPTGACAYPATRDRKPFASGNGTPAAPYVICNLEQFLEMYKMSRTGDGANAHPVFRLRDNIDLASIPNFDNNPVSAFNFEACSHLVFEGNGYTISNLVQVHPDRDFVGLFSCFEGLATDVNLLNPLVIGRDGVGAFAGMYMGFMNSVVLKGGATTSYVQGRNKVGGLIGMADRAAVSMSSVQQATVKAMGDFVGGLVGWSKTCVTVQNSSFVGGSITYAGAIGGTHGNSYGGIGGSDRIYPTSVRFDGTITGNRNVCGVGGREVSNAVVKGRVRSYVSDASGVLCDDYNSDTGALTPMTRSFVTGAVINASIEAPKRSASVFLQGDYFTRTNLANVYSQVTLQAREGEISVTGLDLADPYAEVADLWALDRDRYHNFLWKFVTFEVPTANVSTPEVLRLNEFRSGNALKVVKSFNHPAVYSYTIVTQDQALLAAFMGAPSSPNNVSKLSVTVGGSGVASYRYKFGPKATTDCGDQVGYSGLRPISAAIDDDLRDLADGVYRICAIGRSLAAVDQTYSRATQYDFTRDTTPPAPVEISTPVSSVAVGSDARGPAIATSETSVDVGVKPSAEVAKYLYKYGATWQMNCDDPIGYQGPVASMELVKAEIAALPYAAVRLCVIGIDAAGNKQSVATSKTFTRDGLPPKVVLAGYPFGESREASFSLRASGTNLTHYKIKSGPAATTDCSSAAGYSGQMAIAQATTVSVAGFADGKVVVCAVGRSVTDNWQTYADATQVSWIRDTAAPTVQLFGTLPNRSNASQLFVRAGGDQTDAYKFKIGLAPSVNCADAAGYSDVNDAVKPIQVDLVSYDQSQIRLCVIGRDRAGNWQTTATATSSTWTRDTIAPGAALSGQPSGRTNVAAPQLSIARASSVGGDEVVNYKMKFGAAASTDCADATGYSAVTAQASKINADVSALADGDVRVCVIAQDEATNWTALANATAVTWTKDTVTPKATISGMPTGRSNATSPAIAIAEASSTGGDSVKFISYKFGLSASTDCAIAAGYSATTARASGFTANIESLADGDIRLCVIALDEAGNWTPYAQASTATWTKDTTAPQAEVSGQPTGRSRTLTATAAVAAASSVGGDTVKTYSYKIGPSASTDCAVALGYTAAVPQATPISIDVTAVADGDIRLCILAEDDVGNKTALTAATAVTWTKDTTAPSFTLSGVPTGTSTNKTPQVDLATGLTGPDPVTQIKFKVGASASTDCSSAAGYSSGMPAGSGFVANVTSAPNGPVRLCVIGTDQAGNWTPNASAVTATWTKAP